MNNFQMYYSFSFLFLMLTNSIYGQISNYKYHADSIYNSSTKGLFKNGSIDFISSGMINSNAQLFNVNIGNPKKFHLPFYFLIGTTIDLLKEERAINEATVIDLINTKGGMINFGFKDDLKILYTRDSSIFYLTYQFGAKTIQGAVIEVGNQVSFLSKIINLGIKFSTTAWNIAVGKNEGYAWINPYLSCSVNDKEKMQLLLSSNCKGTLFGSNLEGGIIVKNYIDLRFGYYKYLTNQEIPLFKKGIFKLTANFYLNK